MTKNLQDLRAEARAEMNERFHEVSESDAVWLDTLIDSVLDRAEACVPEKDKPKLGSENQDSYVQYAYGFNDCREEFLTNLSTLRS